MTEYYSNGKLLLAGEYLVLYGAKALVLPLKFGQSTKLESSESRHINWESYDINGKWFEATYEVSSLNILLTTDKHKANYLKNLLSRTVELSGKNILVDGMRISNRLNFNRKFGFGSSSTLIYNLARIFEVDPFKLHTSVSKGSGFDIAAAENKSVFIFKGRDKKPDLIPEFKFPDESHVLFVYLNKKQATEVNLNAFINNNQIPDEPAISQMNSIIEKMVNLSSTSHLIEIMTEHEVLVSRITGFDSLKKFFDDFDGGVKSLGAWGGDFILAASEKGMRYMKEYFLHKGYPTVYEYKELII